MIVDSSALVAIVRREPSHEALVAVLADGPLAGVGTPTLTETGIVLAARLGERGLSLLERLVADAGLVEVPFDEAHWRVAVSAFTRFGKGRHPAALNLGDCLTYATARIAERPLLCVGDDFARTDIELVDDKRL